MRIKLDPKTSAGALAAALALTIGVILYQFGITISTETLAIIVGTFLTYFGIVAQDSGTVEQKAQSLFGLPGGNEIFIQLGVSALLSAIKDPKKNRQVKNLALQLMRAILTFYATDPEIMAAVSEARTGRLNQ